MGQLSDKPVGNSFNWREEIHGLWLERKKERKRERKKERKKEKRNKKRKKERDGGTQSVSQCALKQYLWDEIREPYMSFYP